MPLPIEDEGNMIRASDIDPIVERENEDDMGIEAEEISEEAAQITGQSGQSRRNYRKNLKKRK